MHSLFLFFSALFSSFYILFRDSFFLFFISWSVNLDYRHRPWNSHVKECSIFITGNSKIIRRKWFSASAFLALCTRSHRFSLHFKFNTTYFHFPISILFWAVQNYTFAHHTHFVWVLLSFFYGFHFLFNVYFNMIYPMQLLYIYVSFICTAIFKPNISH